MKWQRKCAVVPFGSIFVRPTDRPLHCTALAARPPAACDLCTHEYLIDLYEFLTTLARMSAMRGRRGGAPTHLINLYIWL